MNLAILNLMPLVNTILSAAILTYLSLHHFPMTLRLQEEQYPTLLMM